MYVDCILWVDYLSNRDKSQGGSLQAELRTTAWWLAS